MKRRDLLLASLLLSACSDSLLHIGFPPAQGGAMILAISTARGVRLEGVPLAPAPEKVTFGSDEEPLHLEALFYDQTLPELGLPAGPIEFSAGGDLLPPPRINYRAENQSGDLGVWVETTLSPQVSEFRFDFPRPSACSNFAVETYKLEETVYSVTFILSISPDLALIGTEDYLYWFDENGPRLVPDQPPDLVRSGGTISAAGVLWFGGADRLWRGRIEGDRVVGDYFPVPLPDPAQEIRWLGASEDQVYLLTRQGVLWLLELRSSRWSVLHRFIPHTFNEGGVAVRANGAMAAVYGSENTIARTKNGTIAIDRLELNSVGLSSVMLLDAYGLVAGSTSGWLLFEEANGYRVRSDTEFGGRIRSIVETDSGLLLSGGQGVVAEYNRALDAICPGQPRAATSIYNGVVVAGGVVLGGSRMFDQTTLTKLTPQ